MRPTDLIGSEARKLLGLPGIQISMGFGVVLPALMTLITARQIRGNLDSGRVNVFVDTGDLAFGEVTFLLPIAIVIGVLAVSSEYRPSSGSPGASRQIGTSLLATSNRFALVAAKAAVVAGVVTVVAALALGLSALIATTTLDAVDWGENIPMRAAAAIGLWPTMALIASGLTWLTRSPIVPLVLLITNASALSVSYLLSRVTDLARFLPDAAGLGWAVRSIDIEPLSPVVAAASMAAWVLAVLGVGALSLARRDT